MSAPLHPGQQTTSEDAAMQALSLMGIRCGIYADDACNEPGSRDCADCENRRRQFLAAFRTAGWLPCDEVVAWLVKKAREHRARGKQYAKQADVIGVLASKVWRGAVRPNNLATFAAEGDGGPEDVPALRAENERFRTENLEAAERAQKEIDRLRAELAKVREDANAKIREAAQRAHDARAELAARPTRAAGLREAAEAVGSEAWPHERDERENQLIYGLVEKLEHLADAAERDSGKDTPAGGESTREEVEQYIEWYGLPWLRWLDEDEQQEFLAELASAALGFYRPEDDDHAVLRDVERACATYRLAAEADHGQATAPGPNAEVCGSQCPQHLQHTCEGAADHPAGECRNATDTDAATCTWDPADAEGGDA